MTALKQIRFGSRKKTMGESLPKLLTQEKILFYSIFYMAKVIQKKKFKAQRKIVTQKENNGPKWLVSFLQNT